MISAYLLMTTILISNTVPGGNTSEPLVTTRITTPGIIRITIQPNTFTGPLRFDISPYNYNRMEGLFWNKPDGGTIEFTHADPTAVQIEYTPQHAIITFPSSTLPTLQPGGTLNIIDVYR